VAVGGWARLWGEVRLLAEFALLLLRTYYHLQVVLRDTVCWLHPLGVRPGQESTGRLLQAPPNCNLKATR